MIYVNLETGVKINLTGLTDRGRKFYQQALEKFRQQTHWLSFDAFAFGALSPLYSGRKSHLEVLKDPLYQALKDMCLQLGVQQGMIKRNASEEKHGGERREETGGGATTERHHSKKGRHLAATR